MKPHEIFDVCHGRYRSLRQFLKGGVSAVDLETPSDEYRWRPDRARAEEFCADYEMIAERALSRPDWKGRRKLFRIYFLWGAEYRRALTLVGVSESTFDYWLDDVKKILGRAFARARLFPPREYFRNRDMARAAAPQKPRRATAKVSSQGDAQEERREDAAVSANGD